MPTPEPGDQYNFTDPESRIMKAGNGNHFEQSYNAQAAVEVDSRLIVGERVSQAPNDKQELVPTLAAIPVSAGPVAAALVDSGFFSAAAVEQIEQTASAVPTGTLVLWRRVFGFCLAAKPRLHFYPAGARFLSVNSRLKL